MNLLKVVTIWKDSFLNIMVMFVIRNIYEKIMSKRLYFIMFIVFLTILSSINIFHSGIIYSDDINFHMHRILAIADNIRIGKYVPVYFNYLNGFGYANGLFYPDLFLFIPAFLCFLGLDIILSLKVFVLIINFVSICTMYLCVYRITKEKKCAYVSMFLYAISSYRLIDFVARGALGEMISFAFLPLVVLGLYEIFFGDYKKGYFLTIGLSCLCFSHVISFYIMVFFTVLFILLNIKCLSDRKRLKSLFGFIFLSMLITVHFWLPMLEQLFYDKFNIGINSRIFDNIVPIYLVFFDLPVYSLSEYYPTGIGLVYYVGLLKFKDLFFKDRFYFTIILFGIISFLFSSFKIIWRVDLLYKVFSVIQFPWRFYMFSSLFFIIGFTFYLKKIGFNRFFKICFIYLIVIYISNVCMYSFNLYLDKPIENEIMMGEYLPNGFRYNLINDYSNKAIKYVRNNNVLNVSVVKSVDSIEVPLIYYKGYVACGDECYEVFKTDNGLVGVKNDKKITEFNVWYEGTKVYHITKYFSFLGLLILIYKIRKCV